MNTDSLLKLRFFAIAAYGAYLIIRRESVGITIHEYQKWYWHKLFQSPDKKIPSPDIFSKISAASGIVVIVWAGFNILKQFH